MSKMKVNICELRNTPDILELDWQALVEHIHANQRDLAEAEHAKNQLPTKCVG